MSVSTSVHRISTDVLTRIRMDPDLVDCLRFPEERSPRELGYLDGGPPALGLGACWEDILRLLSGCGYGQAFRALQDGATLRYRVAGVWVRSLPREAVQVAARQLASVPLDTLGQRALDLRARDDGGRPLRGAALDAALDGLRRLVEFLDQASRAGEALVVWSSRSSASVPRTMEM